ncbi:FUSC family protein [Actinacidiphila acidipaludis]|uniref:FUSC family protein n=1 Tax=Actinacidiphila acidipaludis TaxID=2873382 RepID=A0ABS7Q640_9ACTN|nr:FUSC family protein [Streptomyces acidipaludis]MBY8878621.1 FUSC family protein [Streptomyces acidipaludis]
MRGTTAARRRIAAFWDRYSASDPGLLRLTAGLRTVGAIGLTLLSLALMSVPVPQMVAGAITAMVSTFAIRDKAVRDQAVTLALGLPAALLSVTLGALLNPHIVVGDIFFILLIFGAAYARRFGERGTALGVISFQVYFVSLFVHATPATLGKLCLTVAVAFAASALLRFLLVPARPEQSLARLRQAFRARIAQLFGSQLAFLDADADEREDAIADIRRDTARLHETALMIQAGMEEGIEEERTAELLQRRVAAAEIAAERLGILLINARSDERADTLTLHLPDVPLPAIVRRADDDVFALLRSEVSALRLLVTRLATDGRGAGVAQVRNRLLGYRDDENLPRGSTAVQDAFRGIGEAARSVLGLRLALGDEGDTSDDSPETSRSREEIEAEDASLIGDAAVAEEPTGLRRGTTRAALQVAAGSALAIAGGEFLSTQRWYWAVLTCWVVFLNTSSTGEILVRGYRRLVGTMGGVVAGVLLAGLVGRHTWTAFALVLVLIFLMFFTAPISYALMSFFVTAMLGLLYTLLHTYSASVLVLRIEETALGTACGVIAAVLVLPVRTGLRTDQQLMTVLARLRDVATAAVGQLSGGPAVDLVDMARDLDTALDDLRRSAGPLTHPFTPLRVRRRTAQYVVALLETCAYHVRSLAATAELVPFSRSVAADPRLAAVGLRLEHNLDVLIETIGTHDGKGPGKQAATAAADDQDGKPAEVQTGPSIASMLEGSGPAVVPSQTVTFRVLRHLQRLDESVVALARPLAAPVAAAPGTAGPAGSTRVPPNRV